VLPFLRYRELPLEPREIRPDLFRKACEFGLEGIVSKRRDLRYIAGPQTSGSRSRTGRIRP
jgi:hypothetical protein